MNETTRMTHFYTTRGGDGHYMLGMSIMQEWETDRKPPAITDIWTAHHRAHPTVDTTRHNGAYIALP